MFRYISQFNTLSIILQQTYLTRSLIVQQEEDVFVTFKRQQLVMKTEAALWLSPFLLATGSVGWKIMRAQ